MAHGRRSSPASSQTQVSLTRIMARHSGKSFGLGAGNYLTAGKETGGVFDFEEVNSFP